MDEPFDPYHKWLGISPAEQPPNHYRLLGVNLFENDPDVIDAAANRQMAHVRTYQTGPHSEASQELLNELSAARICLLAPEKKAAYDAQLRAALAARMEGWQPAGPPFEYHVKGAARYLWIEAKRFWISQLRLPAAYQALGEAVYFSGRCRDRLGVLVAQFEAVSRSLASLQQPDAQEEPRGFVAKVKSLGRTLTTQFRSAVFGRKRRSLLCKMGQAAYQSDPQGSGPEHLTAPVREALDRLAQLRAEVAQLAAVPPEQFLSPQRLAWIVLAVISFPVLLILSLRLLRLVF